MSVVIPTLNEAANLPHVLARIPAWVHEVVIVDGHSRDGTLAVARERWGNEHIVAAERRRRAASPPPGMPERRRAGMVLRLVAQPGRGKGDALRAGFAAATGEIVAMLDADGSLDPAELPAFVAALAAGADVAKGSRFLPGGGSADITFVRRLGNRGLLALVRLLCGGRYTELCYGYAAYWRAALRVLAPDADGFEIETQLNVRALRAGLRVAEVPSFEHARLHGLSNLNAPRDGLRVLRTILRETRWRPADWPARRALGAG